MTSKRARFVTYGEQVDLVRNAPRAAALGMRTVPGTWQSHPVVRSQRVIFCGFSPYRVLRISSAVVLIANRHCALCIGDLTVFS